MIAIPSLEEEDAKRPGREHDALVGERTRIINRFKSTLAWLGIRGFKPHLRKAATRLETFRTPEGAPLPDNTLAELRHGSSPWVEDAWGDEEAKMGTICSVRAAEGLRASGDRESMLQRDSPELRPSAP